MSEDFHETISATQRDAVILVHGISPYQPMQALENFAKSYAQARFSDAPDGITIDHRSINIDDSTNAKLPYYAIVGPATTDPELHFFEALWSPISKNHVSSLRLLAWLIAASFRPKLFLGEHSQIAKHRADAIATLCLQIVIACFVCLFAFLMTALIYAMKVVWETPSLLATISFVGSALMISWYGWSSRGAFFSVFSATKTDRCGLIIAVIAFFAIFLFTVKIVGFYLVPYGRQNITILSIVALLAMLARVSYWISANLQKYAADVYVATRTDINDEVYKIREAVTSHVARLIDAVANAQSGDRSAYRNIIVIGHSLGSVIAIDALRQLSGEQAARESPIDFTVPMPSDEDLRPLLRLKALVTCGSPLQKLGSFRGTHLDPRTLFESYLDTSLLKMFRRAPEHIQWINFWNMKDRVSDPLTDVPWLAEPGVISDYELRFEKDVHGAYASQPEFWRNAEQLGVLDLLENN